VLLAVTLRSMPDLFSVARSGVGMARRSADVALSLPRIALALERLADSADDLRRIADVGADLRRIADVGDDLRSLLQSTSGADLKDAQDMLKRVADTVAELNFAVASLNSTVSPLQGATERLGRLVDRLPAGRRTRVVDVEPS
jgi:ABC-type transporter Mla subunit MlaD